MSSLDKIDRNTALNDMDITQDIQGKIRTFSIKWVDIKGEIKYLSRAKKCGAGRMHNRQKRYKGVIECDVQGNSIGHVYPVCIDNIIQYKGKEVVL